MPGPEMAMKEQLTQRLQQLKNEYEAGQRVLADLDTRAQEVRTTLLRIGGAIQVLEEELQKAKSHS
jgi:hypothetical protein